MTDNIPEDARERAETVLRSLIETMRELQLPEGPNTAVVFRIPETAE